MNIINTFYFFILITFIILLHSHPLKQHYYFQISLIPIINVIPFHQLVFHASSILIHFIIIYYDLIQNVIILSIHPIHLNYLILLNFMVKSMLQLDLLYLLNVLIMLIIYNNLLLIKLYMDYYSINLNL